METIKPVPVELHCVMESKYFSNGSIKNSPYFILKDEIKTQVI